MFQSSIDPILPYQGLNLRTFHIPKSLQRRRTAANKMRMGSVRHIAGRMLLENLDAA
jgi:hypothetical protein